MDQPSPPGSIVPSIEGLIQAQPAHSWAQSGCPRPPGRPLARPWLSSFSLPFTEQGQQQHGGDARPPSQCWGILSKTSMGSQVHALGRPAVSGNECLAPVPIRFFIFLNAYLKRTFPHRAYTHKDDIQKESEDRVGNLCHWAASTANSRNTVPWSRSPSTCWAPFRYQVERLPRRKTGRQLPKQLNSQEGNGLLM